MLPIDIVLLKRIIAVPVPPSFVYRSSALICEGRLMFASLPGAKQSLGLANYINVVSELYAWAVASPNKHLQVGHDDHDYKLHTFHYVVLI